MGDVFPEKYRNVNVYQKKKKHREESTESFCFEIIHLKILIDPKDRYGMASFISEFSMQITMDTVF